MNKFNNNIEKAVIGIATAYPGIDIHDVLSSLAGSVLSERGAKEIEWSIKAKLAKYKVDDIITARGYDFFIQITKIDQENQLLLGWYRDGQPDIEVRFSDVKEYYRKVK